ncbi:MAG: cytochrome c [Myxococcales bacterium]|nr:cytochrome c [Myxococcales bacterium]
MSTHDKASPEQESLHAQADAQGFEDDKPYTAALGAFVGFLAIFIVGSIIAATQMLQFELSQDLLQKDQYVRADSVAYRTSDRKLIDKGGKAETTVDVNGTSRKVVYAVDPIEQGIQLLIKNPKYIGSTPVPAIPAAPAPAPRREAPAPAPRREAPAPAPRREAPAPAPRREAPKPAPRREAPKPTPRAAAPKFDAATLAAGKKLFTANACWTCHGNEGNGKGPAAAGLAVKPANFVAGAFKYGGTLGDIYKIITNGSPNKASGMVAYKHLTDNDRWNLAKYVLSLKKAK